VTRSCHDPDPTELYHFSEDPHIVRFVPHVPPTNPSQPPSVWTIDASHEALYWFPRDCPRIAVWPYPDQPVAEFCAAFGTVSPRLHVIEHDWLARVAAAQLYRYTFAAAPFSPWPEASGQWVTSMVVEPIRVEEWSELPQRHADAAVELRAEASLWPTHDRVLAGGWDFSMVRLRNARLRA
jgi:hypothetical protein